MTSARHVADALIAAYNRHDLAAYERLHRPDARVEFAGGLGEIGLDAWMPVVAGLFASVPDLTIEPLTVLADDSTAVIEMHQVGTHTGLVDDVPPTGRAIDIAGVVVLTAENGAVTHERHHWPPREWDQQLGVVTIEARPTRRAAETAHS